jgi:hypothetical protein
MQLSPPGAIVSTFYVVLCAALAGRSAQAGTRYVNANLTSGANDGSSWANAHQGPHALQAALAAAVAGDEVWVAQGDYLPTSTGLRTVSFQLKNGVALYGGFLGVEGSTTQRQPQSYLTILTGDLAGDDLFGNFGENSLHVLNGAGTNATAVCDGFWVTGGNANVSGSNQDRGGGILCVGGASPTIRNCTFSGNRCTFGGGAGYINGSSPTFSDCLFRDNVGGSFGGAFDMATSVGATFDRCAFFKNSAARAGAIEIFGSSPVKVFNCLFFDNTATGATGGGAIFVSGSNPQIRNCTIADNKATNSLFAGILAGSGAPIIVNCVVFGNVGQGSTGSSSQLSPGTLNVTYSIVPAGYPGLGNVFGAPVFEGCGPLFYLLDPSSPGVDAGDNAGVVSGVTLDLLGNPRFADDPLVPDTGAGTAPIVDMGAFENPPDCNANGQPDFCDIQGLMAADVNNNGIPDACEDFGSGLAYCITNPSFAGCSAQMNGSGLPSLSVPSGYSLTATQLDANQNGILFFGVTGGAQTPFSNALLCVNPPLYRLDVQNSGGGSGCSGSFGYTLLDLVNHPVGGPLIQVNQQIRVQAWYRDPSSAPATGVSNAWKFAASP